MKVIIKQKRLSNIINSAEKVFFENDFSKTSVSDICKIANCSRTTFYSHFESKENVYLAVVNKSFQQFLMYFSRVPTGGKNGRERILELAKTYLEFSKQHPKNYLLILDFYTILKKIENKSENASTHILIECPYFEEVKINAKLPFKVMIEEIKSGQWDQSISSKRPAKLIFLNVWAFLIGATNLAPYSDNSQAPDSIFVEEQDWTKNILAEINRMIS